MPSWVQIANRALRKLGANQITSLDEATEAARAVNSVYEQVRDEVLVDHPWNCALVRASLSANTTEPAFGYTYQYTLPGDPYCLRVWRMEQSDIEYRVEQGPDDADENYERKLLTDEGGPLYILYIARITDPAQFSPGVAAAISAAIADAIAYKLTNSVSLAESVSAWAEKVLRKAKQQDAQEGTPETVDVDDFLGSRLL